MSGVGVNIDVLQVWSLSVQEKDIELVGRKFSWVLELF